MLYLSFLFRLSILSLFTSSWIFIIGSVWTGTACKTGQKGVGLLGLM